LTNALGCRLKPEQRVESSNRVPLCYIENVAFSTDPHHPTMLNSTTLPYAAPRPALLCATFGLFRGEKVGITARTQRKTSLLRWFT